MPRPYLQGGATSAVELDLESIRSVRITAQACPRKTPRYFQTRYLEHPYYMYRVHALVLGHETALIASRVAQHQGRRAIRIVDFVGPEKVLAESGDFLSDLINESHAEHIDLIEHGLHPQTLRNVGMARNDPSAKMIVPNQFEPFVRANAIPLAAFRAPTHGFRIFRADGDQDRPNQSLASGHPGDAGSRDPCLGK